MLSVLVFTGMIFFSSAMFFAEQTGTQFDIELGVWLRPDGTPSPFQSIFHSFWWCIATMTTVGYGDAYPITLAGKVVGGITSVMGVVMLSFPIAIFGLHFNAAYVYVQRRAQ